MTYGLGTLIYLLLHYRRFIFNKNKRCIVVIKIEQTPQPVRIISKLKQTLSRKIQRLSTNDPIKSPRHLLL